MCLMKVLGTKAMVDISYVISAADQDRFARAMNIIEEICSKAEDNMFHDYPDLPNEYIDVFYGSTQSEPRNDMDRLMIEKARKEVLNLLYTDEVES